MKSLFILALSLTSLISISTYAKSKGISELLKATNGIYRGPRPINVDEMQMLAKSGIKSIVNLQGGDMNSSLWKYISFNEPGEKPLAIAAEKSVANTLNLQFINTPLNSLDPVTNEEDKLIDQALLFMHSSKNQPVYIHCEHGKDRTGLVIALYKVKYEGMSVDEAYAEWVTLGHSLKSQILTGNLDVYFSEKVKEIKGQ